MFIFLPRNKRKKIACVFRLKNTTLFPHISTPVNHKIPVSIPHKLLKIHKKGIDFYIPLVLIYKHSKSKGYTRKESDRPSEREQIISSPTGEILPAITSNGYTRKTCKNGAPMTSYAKCRQPYLNNSAAVTCSTLVDTNCAKSSSRALQ